MHEHVQSAENEEMERELGQHWNHYVVDYQTIRRFLHRKILSKQ